MHRNLRYSGRFIYRALGARRGTQVGVYDFFSAVGAVRIAEGNVYLRHSVLPRCNTCNDRKCTLLQTFGACMQSRSPRHIDTYSICMHPDADLCANLIAGTPSTLAPYRWIAELPCTDCVVLLLHTSCDSCVIHTSLFGARK